MKTHIKKHLLVRHLIMVCLLTLFLGVSAHASLVTTYNLNAWGNFGGTENGLSWPDTKTVTNSLMGYGPATASISPTSISVATASYYNHAWAQLNVSGSPGSTGTVNISFDYAAAGLGNLAVIVAFGLVRDELYGSGTYARTFDVSNDSNGGHGGWIYAQAPQYGPGSMVITNLSVTGGAPVPIPGAVWLLGSGLVGLIAIRRRFKK